MKSMKYKKSLQQSSKHCIIMKELFCRSVSQYHLLDAWRNSLDPAPKIGLLIAEEEGQNLSTVKVL